GWPAQRGRPAPRRSRRAPPPPRRAAPGLVDSAQAHGATWLTHPRLRCRPWCAGRSASRRVYSDRVAELALLTPGGARDAPERVLAALTLLPHRVRVLD